jgi:uncharacterized membrane protein YphA (DoxX/SURF4 family)
MLVRRIARPLLSAAFIGQGIDALRRPQLAAEAARPMLDGLKKLPGPAATKVPDDAEMVARINAFVQTAGGLLLASGRLPRVASAALACSVLPGSLGGHIFWTEPDPARKAQQRREFLIDLSLIGGLMIAAVDTEGRPSLGWRGRHAAKRASETVASALTVASGGAMLGATGEKVSRGLQAGTAYGRQLADTATDKAGPLLDVAGERAAGLAGVVRERAPELAETVRERGAELAETALGRGTELAQAVGRRAGKRFS